MAQGIGGLVLCGGFSRRMGQDKAGLVFGDETMLQRTVRLVRAGVGHDVTVVAREGQDVAVDAPMVRDAAEGLGPLAGLAAGLAATEAEHVFLTSCDAPLLRPALIAHLLTLAAGHDLVVPVIDGHHMMTTAVYGRAVLPTARELVATRRLRPFFLLEAHRTRLVAADELRAVDPDLASFVNCNTPAEYEAAMRTAFPTAS